ncbi:MAG: nicotinate phosphoribosyltransferase [Halofilum sp. (in: g-proteobacteria)]|nr:nicotinate phosphoribosyltransferase [Halofilum sp. (in: g-proteobacteria)]
MTPPNAGPLTIPGGSLFTDLYELSMAQAYVADGLTVDAEFELYFRHPEPERPYVIAAGLEAVLAALEQFGFTDDELAYLDSLERFSRSFIDWLAAARFEGEVTAVPEGTAVFGDEPLLRLRAPLPLAQLLETRVLNHVHFESLIATKAARMVDAAAGRNVVDFGARRAHGVDAAIAAARASWIGGCAGTSNMVAGQRHELPVVGTMAHSFVQAHRDELEAFRRFVAHYPDTTLLVDTYDTLEGVRNVIRLAEELGSAFSVRAIRIDSGDLGASSREARSLLDDAGLGEVAIIVSGGLDEHRIAALVADGAPVDGFGVGTELVVSGDLPSLDCAYKLVACDDEPRMKTSAGKASLPGPKQVFRNWREGRMEGDTIAAGGEALAGEPLLQTVMRGGARLDPPEPLAAIRERAAAQRAALPAHLRRPDQAAEAAPYPVAVSEHLQQERDRLAATHAGGSPTSDH